MSSPDAPESTEVAQPFLEVNNYDPYFKSIGFKNAQGERTTSGVLLPGAGKLEVDIAANENEYVTVTLGKLEVGLVGTDKSGVYLPGHTVILPHGQKVTLQALEPTTYLCRYEPAGKWVNGEVTPENQFLKAAQALREPIAAAEGGVGVDGDTATAEAALAVVAGDAGTQKE